MKVGDLMTREVVTVTPDTQISEFCRLMQETGLAGVPVVDGEGRLVGIVSNRDVLANQMASTETEPVHTDIHELLGPRYVTLDENSGPRIALWIDEIMTRDPVTVTPDDPLESAADLIIRHRVHRLPVIDGPDRRVVGMISTFDFVRLAAGGEGAG